MVKQLLEKLNFLYTIASFDDNEFYSFEHKLNYRADSSKDSA
jgi:hypothetical protein